MRTLYIILSRIVKLINFPQFFVTACYSLYSPYNKVGYGHFLTPSIPPTVNITYRSIVRNTHT